MNPETEPNLLSYSMIIFSVAIHITYVQNSYLVAQNDFKNEEKQRRKTFKTMN